MDHINEVHVLTIILDWNTIFYKIEGKNMKRMKILNDFFFSSMN